MIGDYYFTYYGMQIARRSIPRYLVFIDEFCYSSRLCGITCSVLSVNRI